jgi:hypothetical protein
LGSIAYGRSVSVINGKNGKKFFNWVNAYGDKG